MLGRFVKDIIKYSPSQFLPALTAFITTPILTRLLPPNEYGYWALAGSASAFLGALAVSGYGSAVIRFYPAYKARSALNIFLGTLSVSAGTAIIVVAGISYLILFVFQRFLPFALVQFMFLIILIFVAQSIFTIFISLIRAQEKSGSFTSFQLFITYGSLLIGLFLAVVTGLRVDGLLWGTLLTLVLVLPFLIALATKGVGIHPREFSLTDAHEIWSYAWPLTLGNVAMWGLRVSDLFIISAFRPEREVGLYTVSYNISSKSIELLVSLFLLSVSPLLMTTWEDKGREATERTLTVVTRVYLLVCLPAAIGLSVLASPFVASLTSPDYYEGSKIVGFVVFSSFAWGLSNIALMGAAIKKQARQLGTNQVIAAATHIGLQLLLVPRFGYIASAISTLIGYTVLLILQTLTSRPHLKWQFPVNTLRNVIAASIVMGFAAWGIYRISDNGNKGAFVYLLLSIVAAVLIYFACLWWLGEIRNDEKNAVIQIWNRVKSKET